jgi:hypothetical protein
VATIPTHVQWVKQGSRTQLQYEVQFTSIGPQFQKCFRKALVAAFINSLDGRWRSMSGWPTIREEHSETRNKDTTVHQVQLALSPL